MTADEYLGYATRFIEKVKGKNLSKLPFDEIYSYVKNSFHPDQIGKFASEDKVKKIAENIFKIRPDYIIGEKHGDRQ